MGIIEIRGLSFTYAGHGEPALREIDLSVDEGEFVVIMGPTGCGKSSLLRCINGLIPWMYPGRYEGEVRVLGMNPAEVPTSVVSRSVGMVFQNPDNQLFSLSVEADVAFPLENIGLPREEIVARVRSALRSVGIEPLAKRSPFELSGGQKQRVALASVLALEPRVLLLDEPTSSLDPYAARSLIELLARLRSERGMTVLLVEHRVELLAPHATRLLVMDEGRIVEDGPPRDVFSRIGEGREWLPIPKIVSISRRLSKELDSLNDTPISVEELRDRLSALMNR